MRFDKEEKTEKCAYDSEGTPIYLGDKVFIANERKVKRAIVTKVNRKRIRVKFQKEIYIRTWDVVNIEYKYVLKLSDVEETITAEKVLKQNEHEV
jgi:hypothetical protein